MTFMQRLIGGSAIIAGAALLPGLAFATAANTTITNTVTVNYTDAANNAQTPVEASVSILVNLVAAAPTLSSPANVDPTTENTGVNLVYTITSNANGPDTYAFSSSDTEAGMTAAAGFTTPSVTLGGTTLAANLLDGDAFIVVPYDEPNGAPLGNPSTSNATVNGITAGDIIVVGSAVYQVGTIDKDGTLSNNTVQIPLLDLNGDPVTHSGGTILAGTQVGERQTVTVVVTTTLLDGGNVGTHTVLTTATSQTSPNPATTQTTATVITVRRPVLTVSKLVRNVSSPAFNPAAGAVSVGGSSYFASGVTGNPNDVMEYVIIVDNSGADATEARNIVVEDPIPQFTELDDASVFVVTATTDTAAAVIFPGSAQDVGINGDAVWLNGNTLVIYAGDGGIDSGTGGVLEAGERSFIRFQVEIQ
jgi:hypothetical protein